MALDLLSKYGTSFQNRLIALLLSDSTYLSQIYDILSEELFESDSNKFLVNLIKEYYLKYNAAPGLTAIGVKITEMPNEVLRMAATEQIKTIKQYIDYPEDLKFIKDEFKQFCKNQRIKSFVLDSIPLIKEGKYDEMSSRFDAALNFGESEIIGLDYAATVDDRYNKQLRLNLVDTEWPIINEITDGGLGAGDLGVVVGISGIGKSWSLVSLGLNSLLKGRNVLHFTLELRAEYVNLRYDSRLTGIASQNLKYNSELVKENIKNLVKGKLITEYFPSKSASVITLRATINKCLAYGFKPDIILIDYADLLKSSTPSKDAKNSYYEMGSIYEELRGLAGEFEVPIWTVSQANKSSGDDDIITGDKVAESYKKVMTADLVISVSRKIEDKLGNTARWYIIKNRYGPDALTFPSKMDSSIGRIEIYSPTSMSGTETRKDMRNSQELVRKELANRFSDMVKGFE